MTAPFKRRTRLSLLLLSLFAGAFLLANLLSPMDADADRKPILSQSSQTEAARARGELRKLLDQKNADGDRHAEGTKARRPDPSSRLRQLARDGEPDEVAVLNVIGDRKKTKLLQLFHATLKALHQDDASYNDWMRETLASGAIYKDAQSKLLSEVLEQINNERVKIATLEEWIESTKSRLILGIRTRAPASIIEDESRQVQQWETHRLDRLTHLARLQGLISRIETQTSLGIAQFNKVLHSRRTQEIERREGQAQYLERLNYGLDTFDSRQEPIWRVRQPFAVETYLEYAPTGPRHQAMSAIYSRPTRRPASALGLRRRGMENPKSEKIALAGYYKVLGSIQETDELLEALRNRLQDTSGSAPSEISRAFAPSNL